MTFIKNDSIILVSLVAIVAVVCVAAIVIGSQAKTAADQTYTVGLAAAPKTSTGNIWQALQVRGVRGEHYTLNIHGKKSDFQKQDCTATPDPVTGDYGNNVFIPSNTDSSVNNQILMVSGNAKGKFASTAPVYGVRDTCVAAFDGDAAELVIPPADKGYYVVARVLGKPTNDPQLSLQGDLVFVQDEFGNDLLVLGLVTSNGFATPSTTLTRSKGNVKAVDITGLFEWNGDVCYFDGSNYCYDDFGQYTCTATNLCCQDTDSDGLFDSCTAPSLDSYGTEYCDAGTLTTLACQSYVNEWVFNIGDLVGYMWDVYSDGDFKLANIRFYPVP